MQQKYQQIHSACATLSVALSVFGWLALPDAGYAQCSAVRGIVFRCALDIPTTVVVGIQAFPSGQSTNLFLDENDPNNPVERNTRRSRANTRTDITTPDPSNELDYTTSQALKDVATATTRVEEVPSQPSARQPGVLD